ncbi:hypothetical protein C8Q78DRAFT_986253, partial [Trametes maxima]
EWRDALWGDYEVDEDGEPEGASGRVKIRHQLRQSLRRLFGQLASLPSYNNSATPGLDGTAVTLRSATEDLAIQQRLVWEAHEVNWRCELLALDALIVGSDGWPELERWLRETTVSEVWGTGSSGVDIAPRPCTVTRLYCWLVPPQPGWEDCRAHLQAFLDVLSRWPGYPKELHNVQVTNDACHQQQYCRVSDVAVAFYVKRFVTAYHRLPIPPVRVSGDMSR